jgi:hypothetical protein
VGGELEFATPFDSTLLRIYSVLIALTAIGFIVATKGKPGYEPDGEIEAGSTVKEPAAGGPPHVKRQT